MPPAQSIAHRSRPSCICFWSPFMAHAIIGLGNPGSQYHNTRHNCGFRFIDLLTAQLGVELKLSPRLRCKLVRTRLDGTAVTLVQPITYMNLSGEAFVKVARYYRIEPASIIVVHDELDLPAGTVRLKVSGGAGGHNGLSDIIARAGTRDFVRIRIGIGRPPAAASTVPYVLSVPPRPEFEAINAAIGKAVEHTGKILQGHHAQVMNTLHARPPTAKAATKASAPECS